MMCRVLKPWDPMIEVDFHIPCLLPSPISLPGPFWDPVFAAMRWTGFTALWTTTVFTQCDADTMVRGTDIGPGIVHLLPSWLTPIDMLCSGSKSYFGPSAINVTDQH